MTAALEGVSGQQHVPAALYPRERPGTHCTGGWMGPRAGLDGRNISSPPAFDPGPCSPQSVAILIELPGPHFLILPSFIQPVKYCGLPYVPPFMTLKVSLLPTHSIYALRMFAINTHYFLKQIYLNFLHNEELAYLIWWTYWILCCIKRNFRFEVSTDSRFNMVYPLYECLQIMWKLYRNSLFLAAFPFTVSLLWLNTSICLKAKCVK